MLGITPACAGKTASSALFCVLRRDHPRVCGKNSGKNYERVARGGSPPRVREKPMQGGGQEPKIRITPACAGKTVFYPTLTMLARDHPRVCGKNLGFCINQGAIQGSPPRVREKPLCRCIRLLSRRITPACAGKTYNSLNEKAFVSGSPPRVREKLQLVLFTVTMIRITPACAGKTRV